MATLAQLLRADLLPEAWTGPLSVRQQRAVLRHRAQLVRLRTLLHNRIHAVLADHGYARETTRSCWSGPGRLWLDQLPLPAASRTVITDLLELIDAVQVSIDRVDAPLRAEAKNEPWVKVLTTLPGGGPLTALVLLAEIGDIQRFPSARKLAFWTGLSPTVRGSDRTVHYRRISRQGDPWVRWILSEAARTAKRSPQFAACYEQIAHRRGEKITTIAIARKLLTRTWHLLME